jgi:hypothetical protein
MLRALHLVAQLPALANEHLAKLVYPDKDLDDAPDLVGLLEQWGLVRSYFEHRHVRDETHAVLTKQGIRTLANGLRITPETLVARYALDDASLADRVGHPTETLHRYRVLAKLADAERGITPQLVTWRRHWPPDQPGYEAEEPLRSALPARATLRWGAQRLSYLLLADPTDEDAPLVHNVRPVEFYRPILDELLEEHVHRREPVPRLFVVLSNCTVWRKDHGRAGRWRALLEDAQKRFPHLPFRFQIDDFWPSTRAVSRAPDGLPEDEEHAR